MHRSYHKQSGQVLIQVAMMIGVLLLMAALAVDVGNMYAERRHMQNAADAGALAGARALCLGYGEGAAIGQAQAYAAVNGASGAAVTINGYRVLVEASTAAQMFFAGIVGIHSVDVSAVAEAKCGCASSPCNVFPMTFDEPTWNSIEDCDQEFLVWDDDHLDDADIWTKCFCTTLTETLPLSVKNIGPGHRGWLRLSEPPPSYENLGGCGGDCGAASLKCWILNGHGAPIDVACVPGKTGVDASAIEAVEDRIKLDPFVNILIWDQKCTAAQQAEGVYGDCPGTYYHIVGVGRVELIGVLTLSLECREGVDCSPSDCPNNVKVIHARKVCGVSFEPCSPLADSEHPCPGGFTAVALIR